MTSYVEFDDVVCMRETAKAIEVSSEGGGPFWIPKSVLSEDTEVYAQGDSGTLIVAEWFIEKEGIEL